MSLRPRSPSAGPAPRCGPAKRPRLQQPAGPEPWLPPGLEAPAAPADGALPSVLVLPAGCVVHVSLDDVDVLLEPEPSSVLQVGLPGCTLILVPEGLASADPSPGGRGPAPHNLSPGGRAPHDPHGAALPTAAQDAAICIEQGFAHVTGPEAPRRDSEDAVLEVVLQDFEDSGAILEVALQDRSDDVADDAAPVLLELWSELPPSAGSSSSSASGAEPWPLAASPPAESWDLDGSLLGFLPDSPLQPLPPSPPPGVPAPLLRRLGSRACCTVRRRLFQ